MSDLIWTLDVHRLAYHGKILGCSPVFACKHHHCKHQLARLADQISVFDLAFEHPQSCRIFGGADLEILSRNPLFVRKIISATAFMEISHIPFSYLESENAQSRQEKPWAAISSLFGEIISACASLEVSKFHLLFFGMGIGEPSPWKNPGSL